MTLPLRSVLHKTLYDYRRLAFFFGIGIFLLAQMYTSIYPSVATNAQFTDFIQQLPAALHSIIGDSAFFTTPEGFINAELFKLTLPILFGILSITIGAGLINKEEESGTIELLLARPYSRSMLLGQKTIGMIVVTMVLALFLLLSLFVGTIVVEEFNLNMWLATQAIAMLLLMSWTFGIGTLMLTTIQKGHGFAIGTAMVVFIASYVIGTFANSVAWLEPFKNISLFEYYKPEFIFQHGFHAAHGLLFVTLIILFYVIADFAFRHRDLRV